MRLHRVVTGDLAFGADLQIQRHREIPATQDEAKRIGGSRTVKTQGAGDIHARGSVAEINIHVTGDIDLADAAGRRVAVWPIVIAMELERSEERRVGKECRSRWS